MESSTNMSYDQTSSSGISPNESSSTDYFQERPVKIPSSKDSSPSRSPSPPVDTEEIQGVTTKLPHHILPPLDRQFPKGPEELNVAEALHRQPGRWTIQGQREANRQRLTPSVEGEDKLKEMERQRLESVKRELRNFAESF